MRMIYVAAAVAVLSLGACGSPADKAAEEQSGTAQEKIAAGVGVDIKAEAVKQSVAAQKQQDKAAELALVCYRAFDQLRAEKVELNLENVPVYCSGAPLEKYLTELNKDKAEQARAMARLENMTVTTRIVDVDRINK